jgi:hypothetical protein
MHILNLCNWFAASGQFYDLVALNLGNDHPVTLEYGRIMYPWIWLCLIPICLTSQTDPPFALTDIYQIKLAKVEITLRPYVGGQT